MCNDYRLLTNAAQLFDGFSETRIKIRFSEGAPNIEAREDIKITDMGPIVRAIAGETGAGDLVQRRWSWPGPSGKPVYNFRSEGREFTSGRCLIPADGFYEFTDPADRKKKRKDKWLFTKTGEPWFCIAGIWRAVKDVGEAFTMLTVSPGPDVAPYHDRQIAIFDRAHWATWLDPSAPAKTSLKTSPRRQPCRRAGGLNTSVTPLRISAHEEKDKPASGSCSYDRHDTSSLSLIKWLTPEEPTSSVTSARRS